MKVSNKENDQKTQYGTYIATNRYLNVIEFEGHSYIFLRNTLSCSGDRLLHDPNCKCINKEKQGG